MSKVFETHRLSKSGEPTIHVLRDDDNGDWAVWINPETSGIHAGMCIGVGKTRDEAVQDAVSVLEAGAETLQAWIPKEA